MAYTHHELKSKTVAQLREIAKANENDSLTGYTVMHKDQLVTALCKALGIEMHEHHEVVGLNKSEIKAQIKDLKGKRDQAIAIHDHAQLKAVRRRMHYLRRMIHKSTV